MAAATRVLITCVGSGIGQSVVDSLKHFKDEYFLVGSDQSRFSYSVPDCDEFISLPQIGAANYLDELLAACAALQIDIVIPGHDLELPLFAQHRDRFESAHVQVMVGTAPLVILLRNKLAWSREFRKRSRRVVPTSSIRRFPSRCARGADRATRYRKAQRRFGVRGCQDHSSPTGCGRVAGRLRHSAVPLPHRRGPRARSHSRRSGSRKSRAVL